MTSILISILFLLATAIELFLIIRLKKNEAELEISRQFWYAIVLVVAIDCLVVGVIDIISIPINLLTATVIHVLISVVLYFYERKMGEKQSYRIDWFVFAGEVLIFIGGIYFFLKLKNVHAIPAFANSDAAVHFKNAMELYRNEHLPIMYLAPMINAFVFEFFSPWLKEISFIKIYSLVDIIIFISEIEFIWILISNKLNSVLKKALGFMFIGCYAALYPLNGFLYSFLYWGMAVVLIEMLMLIVEDIDREKYEIYLLVSAALVLNAITMCYMIFAPLIFIAFFAYELITEIGSRKKIDLKLIKNMLVVFAVPTILAIYYCYFKFLGGSVSEAKQIAMIPGAIYIEAWWDFLWLVPFVIYDAIKQIKRKSLSKEWIFAVVLGLAILVLAKLVIMNKFSFYYYFKFYYPMFMLCVLIAVRAVVEMVDEKNAALWAILIMYMIPCFLQFRNIENRLIATGTNIQQVNHTSNFFLLWSKNRELMHITIPVASEDEFEGYGWILDNLSDKDVPMLSNQEDYKSCYWYEGITGNNSSKYYGWNFKAKTIFDRINKDKDGYFCVRTNSVFYNTYKEQIERYDLVYQNSGLLVYKNK